MKAVAIFAQKISGFGRNYGIFSGGEFHPADLTRHAPVMICLAIKDHTGVLPNGSVTLVTLGCRGRKRCGGRKRRCFYVAGVERKGWLGLDGGLWL